MENQIIDEFNEVPQFVDYASFIRRAGASILDGLVLAPINFGLVYYSMTSAKSFLLLLIPSIISLLYKVILEKEYGQTVGKRLLGISVVGESLQKMTYSQAIIRNYYYVVNLFISGVSYYALSQSAGFLEATTYMEAIQAQAQLDKMFTYITYIAGIFFLIDCFMMYKSELNQTLHDKWAKTVCVRSISLSGR